MRSESKSGGQERRSFIEEARRAQIIDAAIEVVAQRGYVQTTLTRVAEHAGISKGVISYHFAGKDELMEQLVRHIYAQVEAVLAERLAGIDSPREMLREYLSATVGYLHAHHSQVVAMGQVVTTMRSADGTARFGAATSEPIFHALEQMFLAGQETGEFRQFAPRAMAVTVQGAINALADYWFANPDHDLNTHAAELVETFDRAVRAE